MLSDKEEFRQIVTTAIKLISSSDRYGIAELIANSEISIEHSDQDNWNGGTDYFTVFITVNVDSFISLQNDIPAIEDYVLKTFRTATRNKFDEVITKVVFVPREYSSIDWAKVPGWFSKTSLISDIHLLEKDMIDVATFQKKLNDVNEGYKYRYRQVHKALLELNLDNPNPYIDLWDWYEHYKSKFISYQERRNHINGLYKNLLEQIEGSKNPETVVITVDLKGWGKIERTINEIKIREETAQSEEQFQAVGLLCREIIISLAQEVFIAEKHPILDKTQISSTDAKRMLEAYIAVELAGSSNEAIRKYVKSTSEVANALTHKRTATKKDAALCTTATLSLINLIGIIEGRI
jgi:hypothetical protein